MPSEEEHRDSREYLKEVVRSNGRIGRFWVRGDSLCVQIRHPVYGNIRFLVDPEAFGGRGCIYDAVGPAHVGDPFGWQRVSFAEFTKGLRPPLSGRLLMLGRTSVSEARKFVGSSEQIPSRTITRAHHAIATWAPAAAADIVMRIDQLTHELMMDGQKSLSGSLRQRGESSHPTFLGDMLSLHDLLGEACVFRSLFGGLLQGREKEALDQAISRVKGEMQALSDSLEKRAYDVTLLSFTLRLLDVYIITLSRLTSKSMAVPGLTRPALVAFAEEVYYGLLERRTMAENIFAASALTGHPPELERWIAEFRYHDYALRELLDKAHSASPLTLGSPNDMSLFFRDRFGYPPEVAWWMWHAVEKETGMPLDRSFAFDRAEVTRKIGLRSSPSEEVSTALGPEALVGRFVEILIMDSPIAPLIGTVLPRMKVVETTESELDEKGYLMAVLGEPMNISLPEELVFSIDRVRFGSSLPRSPPQAVMDDGFKALMNANPYRRVVVDVSSSPPEGQSSDHKGHMTHVGYGLLGLVEDGRPSIFEIQRYRMVEKFVELQREEAKAWEVDYLR